MNQHPHTTTADQRIKELERELKMKEEVYPRLIKEGKISKTSADYRIRCTQDALADLTKLPKSQLNLF